MAENGLITQDSLGEAKSIDFVERFGYSIKKLMEALGLTNKIPMAQGTTIKQYEYVVTKPTGSTPVGEGEDIPLTKIEKKLKRTVEVTFDKFRKATTAESIQKYGYDEAVNKTDKELLKSIQKDIRKDFFDFMKSSTSTAKNKIIVTNLQEALAQGWGKVQSVIDDDITTVALVNPMDVADYLGDAAINNGQGTIFGMTLLKNFINTNILTFNDVPKGKVYITAAENLNLAYVQISEALNAAFNLTVDNSGYIGVTHAMTTRNATTETLAFAGVKLFPELVDAVIEATIQPEKPETPETKS